MTRKTTSARAKAIKVDKGVPDAAQRPESVNAAETPQSSESENPDWWKNEGGSGEVQ